VYPLAGEGKAYPYQQWWIAAYSDEVARKVLGRTVLGESLVLFRTEAGEAIALSGVCPHRMFPMVKGRLVGDAIQCGYHGFTYDRTGTCILTPSQATPAKASLRRYPVVETAGLIWVWTGEPDLSDPTLLPDIGSIGLGSSQWAVEQHPRVVLQGRYSLLIDNLVDLGHASFLHQTTIPNADEVALLPQELDDGVRSFNVRRLGCEIRGPFVQALFPNYDGAVDQSFDSEYYGPNLIRTGGAVFRAGTRDELGTLNFIHGITPQTDTSTHYFVMTARNFRIDDASLGVMNLRMGERILPQDAEAIEAIEQAIQSGHLPREVSCRADSPGVQVRRKLSTQIEGETAQTRAG
jgi:phenylpropionate dioxygenase-like ring-hydroxylating dioxygenase large terminal subunit